MCIFVLYKSAVCLCAYWEHVLSLTLGPLWVWGAVVALPLWGWQIRPYSSDKKIVYGYSLSTAFLSKAVSG